MISAVIAVFTAWSLASSAEPATATPTPAAPTAAAPTAAAPAPTDATSATTWDQVERTTTVTTTTTTGGPSTVPAPRVSADWDSAPREPPPPPQRSPAGRGLIGGGAGLLALGIVSLLFIAAPAALVKRVALRRADNEESIALSSRIDRYERARHADDVMEGAFWAGVSGVVVGTVLLTAGVVIKNRVERAPRTANRGRRPMVRIDGGAGGLRLRF